MARQIGVARSAAERLGTVFRGSFDPAKLAGLLGFGNEEFVTFVQTVGYPKP